MIFLSASILLCSLGIPVFQGQPAYTAKPLFSSPQLELIKYEFWEIHLPLGWVEDTADPKIVNFESKDKTKALFCIVATSSPQSQEKMEKAFQTLKKASETGRNAFKGVQWKRLNTSRSFRKNEIYYTEEHFDSSKQIRIHVIIQVTPTRAARIAFHDYLCPDLIRSREYFSATVNSFRLR